MRWQGPATYLLHFFYQFPYENQISTLATVHWASRRGSVPRLGQSDYGAGVGNPLKELRSALAGLNASRVPTGVLLNRTLQLGNPHRYAGQGDTVASYSTFEQQYWEFYHAALDTTQLLTLATLRGRIAQRVQQGSIPLLMLHYTYSELSATAAQDHLITIDSVNERVSDGPDLSRSPYVNGQLFSAAPTPTGGQWRAKSLRGC